MRRWVVAVYFGCGWLPLSYCWISVPLRPASHSQTAAVSRLLFAATEVNHNNVSFGASTTFTDVDKDTAVKSQRMTNALLRISYDGGRFTGWSSANNVLPKQPSDINDHNIDSTTNASMTAINKTTVVRVSRRQRRRGILPSGSGFVRSVQGILQSALAKLYGHVDPRQVVVEGTSRTDKGVHARHMVALIYCLQEDVLASLPISSKVQTSAGDDSVAESDTTNRATAFLPALPGSGTVPGKRLPHPSSPTDKTYFLPMCLDLPEFAIRLNHLLPPDIRVTGYATTPTTSLKYFHPSLNALRKTYQYTFSIGMIHDPTQWRFAWQILSEDAFDLERVQQVACPMLVGTHDFAAFRGAPRGQDDKKRQERESTTCTLYQVMVERVASDISSLSFPPRSDSPLETFRVRVMGNRFLYKMVRFLVGALVAIGTHEMDIQDLQTAIASGVRTDDISGRWQCAPSQGLVLDHVEFDCPVHWQNLE